MAGLTRPRRRPAYWSARAISAAQLGALALVPPPSRTAFALGGGVAAEGAVARGGVAEGGAGALLRATLVWAGLQAVTSRAASGMAAARIRTRRPRETIARDFIAGPPPGASASRHR